MTGGGEAEAADTGQAAGGGYREVFLATWGRSVQASGSHVRTQQQTASPAEVLHIGQDVKCCAEGYVRLRT